MNNVLEMKNGQLLNLHLKKRNQKEVSFKITVKRLYTNMVGTVLDKNTLPNNLKVAYPVYLFNTFDSAGGYFLAQKNLPVINDVDFMYSQAYGNYWDNFNTSAFNTIKNSIRFGDQVTVHTDDIENPNRLIWTIVSAEQSAYASLLQNPLRDGFHVFNIAYFAGSEKQLANPIQLIRADEIGNEKLDLIEPLLFRQTSDKQIGYVDLTIKYLLNNYTGLNFMMDFETDAISMIFKYIKLQ